MTADKLKELERGRIPDAPKIVEETFGPPKFITQITSVTAEESEAVRFECQVEPKTDPSLRVEWYRNGKPLPLGHRYRNVFDMGFVSLDILYVYSDDSGEYVCRAVNNHGEDRTKATVSCKSKILYHFVEIQLDLFSFLFRTAHNSAAESSATWNEAFGCAHSDGGNN